MTVLRTAQANVAPNMVDFCIGQPGVSLLPLEIMRQAAEHRLSQNEPEMLNYGAEQGDGYFRQALAQFLSNEYGDAVEPEHLFITGGASQGLDLLSTLFTEPGDTIFVEEPTYFLALRIFADHDLNIVGIPCDEQGLNMPALEEELRNHRPVFIYTIPTYQNPSGVTMTAERRDRLVALSDQFGFFIVADEVYHLLSYTATPPKPFASFVADHNERVLSIGSFSKILAPGLRLGWIQASPDLVNRFARCGMVDSGGGLNPFTSSIVRSVLELGLQDVHLSRLKQVYAHRIQVLDQALQHHLRDAITYRRPDGGFFFWLRLVNGMDAQALSRAAQEQNVRVLPGSRCSSRDSLSDCLRLSFAYFDDERLELGVQRLAGVIANNDGSFLP